MIEKLLIFILFIVFTLNLIDLIKIKWNNDYFKENYNQCYILNSKSLYEIETYRYKLYKYIYNVDNKNLDNTINSFNITFKIIVVLLLLLLILSIKDLYINFSNKILITIIILIFVILIYIYIGTKILDDHKKINEERINRKNYINKYKIVYKILNSLLYLDDNNNVKKEIFKFKINKIENSKTFDEYLGSNISQIYNTNNDNKINYLKKQGYENLDFIKYINLDEISPFYFKEYFDNIYIKLDDNKYYLNDLSNNNRLNEMIKDRLLISGEKIEDIDGIDYIKYYNENKELLFDIKSIKNTISDIIDKNIYIYIYLLIYIILIIIISHILYVTINKRIYSILLLIIIVIYIILLWFKLRMN